MADLLSALFYEREVWDLDSTLSNLYDRVIENGKLDGFEFMWSDYSWLFYVGLLLPMIILIAVVMSFVSAYKVDKFTFEKDGVVRNRVRIVVDDFSYILFSCFYGILFLISVTVVFAYMGVVNSERVDAEVDDWKRTDVVELFDKLPTSRGEVVYLKLDPELAVSDDRLGNVKDTIELTPLVISYKDDDGKVFTITEWVDAKMALSDSEDAYIEYKKLEKNLGNDVNAGVYDIVVYLPKDYKFTEIK